MAEGTYPGLSDLPIANLVQIFSHLSVRDLLQLEASSKLVSTVVNHCLSDCQSLEVSDEPSVVTESVLVWAKAQHKLNNIRSFCAAGHVCAAALETCLKDRNSAANFWPKLTHLKLELCRPLKDSHVALIVQQWPQLTTLDLGGCVNISDASLYTIADNMPNLKSLNCSHWMYVSDDAVSYLARKLPGLKNLSLDGCPRITSRAVTALAQHCPELQSISTATCIRLCNAALAAWSGHRAITSAVFKQCPKLSSIGCLSNCSSLATLDISGCPLVNDSDLHALLAPSGTRIHHLNLYGCSGLTGSSLASISSYCPKITYLNISRMDLTDEHLKQFSLGCCSIQHLCLDWCSKVTDSGLTAVISRSPALNGLSIEGVFNSTDLVLDSLVASCPELCSLNARMCTNLSSIGLVRLLSANKFHSVHLAGIMDDTSMQQLVSNLKRYCPSCRLCY